MRAAIVTFALCLLAPLSAAAEHSPLEFQDGAVRLRGAASWGNSRSIWARGKSLVLVMPGRESLRPRALRTGDDTIKEVRLTGRANRTELELRLSEPALGVLSRVEIGEQGDDLVVRIPPAAPAASAAAASPQGAEAAPGDTTSAKAPKKAGSPAWAREAGKAAPSGSGAGENGGKGLGGLGLKASHSGPSSLWILFGVVGIGAGAAWWLRRRKRNTGLGSAHIDVIAARGLSGKHRLVLVEAAGELVLLGCTDKQITLLRAVDRDKLEKHEEDAFFAEGLRIDEQNSAEQLQTAADSAPAQDTASFMQRLNQQLARRRMPEVVDQTRQPDPPAAGINGDDSSPLDERWAESILKLRRRGGSSSSSSSDQMLH